MEALTPVGYFAAFCVALVAVYVIVRVGSIAHFRTKREFWRELIRDIKGVKTDGEG